VVFGFQVLGLWSLVLGLVGFHIAVIARYSEASELTPNTGGVLPWHTIALHVCSPTALADMA
jgi:hypothetical protein